MGKSKKQNKEGKKNRLTTANSYWNLNNITWNRRVCPASNISYNVTNCANQLHKAKDSHIVVIVTKYRNFLKILIFGDFGFEWIHAKETNGNNNKLWNKASKWLSILYFVSTNTSQSTP